MQLLTLANPKTRKGERFGYLTAILHLAPARLSGRNVCRYAGACAATCLNTSGRGRFAETQAARLRRTDRFFTERAWFFRALRDDLDELVRQATRQRQIPCVRLNGTSDLPWECIPVGTAPHLMALYPTLQFFDYTKWPVAERRALPRNYHLTHSLDVGAASERAASDAIGAGRNVAVVFPDDQPLPRTFQLRRRTLRVIDGDESDLRFRDPPCVVVGLRAKGPARRDTSGFVHRGAA